METYKIHNTLPSMTKEQWINYLNKGTETLVKMKYTGQTYGKKELVSVMIKISNEFNIKLI